MRPGYQYKTQSGFSIGEVLIAATVIVIGILATLNLLYQSRASERANRDYIVGTQLAQEGVEIVRNIRDNDFASGGSGFTVADDSADETFDPVNPPAPMREHCLVDLVGTKWSTGARVFDQYTTNTRMCRNNYTNSFRDTVIPAHAITLNGVAYKRYVNIERSVAPEGAVVVSFVYWGAWSPANSAGYASNVAYVTAMKSQCARVNQCAYSEASLLGWK